MSICVYTFSEILLYQGAKDIPFLPIAKEKGHILSLVIILIFYAPLILLNIVIGSILNITLRFFVRSSLS